MKLHNSHCFSKTDVLFLIREMIILKYGQQNILPDRDLG
jgi:hypothetical protein